MQRDIENVIADLRRQRDRIDEQFAKLNEEHSTEELLLKLRELRDRMGISEPKEEPVKRSGDPDNTTPTSRPADTT